MRICVFASSDGYHGLVEGTRTVREASALRNQEVIEHEEGSKVAKSGGTD